MASRLIGQETEFATLLLSASPAEVEDPSNEDRPSSREVFEQISRAIGREQPCATGIHDLHRLFLASGAALSFETHPAGRDEPGGLVELATPEVRGPEELLVCQRSVDAMVADAAEQTSFGRRLRVLKNSADAFGHVYGCQENYEAEVASGAMLLLYRVLVILAWLTHLVSLLFAVPAIAVTLGFLAVRRRIFGQGSGSGDDPADQFASLPRWFAAAVIASIRLTKLPTVWILRFIARRVAFRRIRRSLTALLVSRIAVCGAGHVDSRDRFRLSAKALAIDRLADLGGFQGERPVYVFGHWLEQLTSSTSLSFGGVRPLLRRQQRLQIGLSDSNLADLAEFVKFGMVTLVLDMIEAGRHAELPRLKRPLTDLRRVARDWHLVARIRTNRGESSALEIQRSYLRAAEKFVAETPAERRGQSEAILGHWREALEVIGEFRRPSARLEAALGKIDWLSKLWLLEQLGPAAGWPERKKVDLRYHELSGDGYYRKLATTLPAVSVVDSEDVARRRRHPPSSSPAAHRGWVIREFAGTGEPLRSDWRYALVGEGKAERRIDYTDPDE